MTDDPHDGELAADVVDCTCFNRGTDPRVTTGLRCGHSLMHAQALDAAGYPLLGGPAATGPFNDPCADAPVPEPVIELAGELQRVALEPGDVLVIRLQQRLQDAELARLITAVRDRFPDNQALVLDHGTELHVVRPTKR